MKPLVPETIETERLTLRLYTLDDLDAVERMVAKAEVMKFTGGQITKRLDAWGFIARTLGHWALRGYGMYAVVEKASGTLVGRIGLLNPETWPDIEIAWTLDSAHWGKGLATEAATAVGRVGFHHLKAKRLISLINPNNLPSIRVAERLGATREGMTDFFGPEDKVYVYRHDPARFT
jgi:RimJ/RimL family protein N-acetyltransferase